MIIAAFIMTLLQFIFLLSFLLFNSHTKAEYKERLEEVERKNNDRYEKIDYIFNNMPTKN